MAGSLGGSFNEAHPNIGKEKEELGGKITVKQLLIQRSGDDVVSLSASGLSAAT